METNKLPVRKKRDVLQIMATTLFSAAMLVILVAFIQLFPEKFKSIIPFSLEEPKVEMPYIPRKMVVRFQGTQEYFNGGKYDTYFAQQFLFPPKMTFKVINADEKEFVLREITVDYFRYIIGDNLGREGKLEWVAEGVVLRDKF